MKIKLSILLLFAALVSYGQVQFGTQKIAITGAAAQTATVNNIIPTSSGSAGTLVTTYSAGAIQVVSTGTAGTFIFEGSNSDANYQTLVVWNDAALTGTPIIAAITATSSNIIYYFPVKVNYVRLRIATTITGGSIQAISKFTNEDVNPTTFQVAQATAANLNVTATGTVTANLGTGGTGATSIGKAEDAASANGDTGVGIMGIRNDALTSNTSASGDYQVPTQDLYGSWVVKDQQRHKVAYSMSFTVTPAAAATDIFQLIGSASKTVEIEKITITGTQTTAGGVTFIVSKRSTANSAGTSSSGTSVAHNSSLAAATAVGTIYTANPTTGTPVGDIERVTLTVPAATAGTAPAPTPYDIIWYDIQPPVLIGVAQAIVINLGGATITGGSLNVNIKFVEY